MLQFLLLNLLYQIKYVCMYVCELCTPSQEICPEMHANKIHELYDRHDKVSSSWP